MLGIAIKRHEHEHDYEWTLGAGRGPIGEGYRRGAEDAEGL